MSCINKSFLQGKIKYDPKFVEKENNNKVCKFILVTWNKFSDNKISFQNHRCVAYGKKAEIAYKYLKKDMFITLECHDETPRMVDAESKKVYWGNIKVIDIIGRIINDTSVVDDEDWELLDDELNGSVEEIEEIEEVETSPNEAHLNDDVKLTTTC